MLEFDKIKIGNLHVGFISLTNSEQEKLFGTILWSKVLNDYTLYEIYTRLKTKDRPLLDLDNLKVYDVYDRFRECDPIGRNVFFGTDLWHEVLERYTIQDIAKTFNFIDEYGSEAMSFYKG